MSTQHIPNLKKKLSLMRTFGAHPSNAAIAKALGVKEPTLRWWIAGDATRPPEHIPAKSVQPLMQLIAAILPTPPGDSDLRRLALGDVRDLETLITGKRDGFLTFTDLIKTEARIGHLVAVPLPHELEIVTRLKPEAAANQAIRLGQLFYLTLKMTQATHALLLQNIQGVWAGIPLAAQSPTMRLQIGTNILPADGKTNPLVEKSDPGLHRFVAIASTRAFPKAITDRLSEGGILSENTLADLGAFLLGLPSASRSIDMLTLSVRD